MERPNHFLDLDRIDAESLREILDYGAALKRGVFPVGGSTPLLGKTLAMIFEKPSTRTRVSFEVGMQQLGGTAVFLQGAESQLGRGETIADTARVLSRYVDVIMIRTDDPEKLEELAAYATVPVINGLTDRSHPCQLMADILTFEEHRGPIDGRVVTWVGDGNNMATSWIHAASKFNFELRLACPGEFAPSEEAMAWAKEKGARVILTTDPAEAVAGSDCVVTDTWVSMGDSDGDLRRKRLAPYQVNEALMARAQKDALFMHCLPAHRGEEVTEAVIDGPCSVVWDEAENRLHAQKGVLTWCLMG
ncbi:MAG: ornithine carbamoyltransferase [Rhodospirillales bacterium]|nr:ornithine carbamoyltransferase [Rhodospirillales bacterium]MCW8952384.1 ornithine carbamoyltransferase [Rhodospirillales bacterium]MCW9002034.1 ornithine carbamoyltransferase [Rhodospirillales bacterium]